MACTVRNELLEQSALFYIPKGLFSDCVARITADELAKLKEGKRVQFQCLKTGSELYQKKASAYGGNGRCRRVVHKRKDASAKNDEDTSSEENENENENESFKTAQSAELGEVPTIIGGVDDDDTRDEVSGIIQEEWL